jgi:hypothetical protein
MQNAAHGGAQVELVFLHDPNFLNLGTTFPVIWAGRDHEKFNATL